MTTLHGLSNCDTVKKARAWLDDHGVAYRFVDFKREPPTPAQLAGWCRAVGHPALVNRRGTTWRALPAATQAAAADEAGAIAAMLAAPSLIRRPVLEHDGAVVVGFDADDYAARFA
jgi:arsenate reductase (glutaredoxin)